MARSEEQGARYRSALQGEVQLRQGLTEQYSTDIRSLAFTCLDHWSGMHATAATKDDQLLPCLRDCRCLIDEVALLKASLAECRQQLKSSGEGCQQLVKDVQAARMLADDLRGQQQEATAALQVPWCPAGSLALSRLESIFRWMSGRRAAATLHHQPGWCSRARTP